MARTGKGQANSHNAVGVTLAAAMAVAIAVAAVPAAAQQTPPAFTRECQAPGASTATESPLPNVAAALQRRKRIRILAIGAAATAGMGARGGYQAQMKRLIRQAAKGVEVEIVNRGVSGELAEPAAQRLKVQVGLTTPDLVLWQVGTNDALSYVEVERVEQTVRETLRWLKEHKVDVVLVGLQYVRDMARDSHYQAIRLVLRRIAREENVIIVRRYEAMELIARAQRTETGPDEFASGEGAYDCLAQYVARAISVALFGRGLRPSPGPP